MDRNLIEQRIKSAAQYKIAYNGDAARREHMSVTNAVVVPFLVAIAIGLFMGYVAGAFMYAALILLRVENPWPITRLAAVLTSSVACLSTFLVLIYLWWQVRKQYDVAMGLNISMKRKVVKELHAFYPSDSSPNGLSKVIFSGIDDAQLLKFAQGMIASRNTPNTTEARWCEGERKTFRRHEFVRFRESMCNKRLGEWLNLKKKTWKITSMGWRFLSSVAEGRYTVKDLSDSRIHASPPALLEDQYDGGE